MYFVWNCLSVFGYLSKHSKTEKIDLNVLIFCLERMKEENWPIKMVILMLEVWAKNAWLLLNAQSRKLRNDTVLDTKCNETRLVEQHCSWKEWMHH